jgi:hypothetical protein
MPDNGSKPEVPEPIDIKIAAVMSLPRWISSNPRGVIEKALHPFKIPLNSVGGAYWHHHLQSAMEWYVKENMDWILTFDCDTFVADWQLDRMFGIFGKHPEIDALVPLQCKRHSDDPLVSIRGYGGSDVEITGEPLRISTGHFGATLIRVDALKQVPKPWFWEKTGPDGSWDHAEHVDPDIGFWKNWTGEERPDGTKDCEGGRTVYLAPTVKIGHMEETISTFDEHCKPIRMWTHKWREHYLGEISLEPNGVKDDKLRLNIGAGNVRMPGWRAIDRQMGSEAYPLDEKDNSVEEIRASHILEHFSYKEVGDVLKDWVRVLKPGCRIRLAVPEIDKCLSLRGKGDNNWFRYIMGGQIDENDFHKSLWTRTSLEAVMHAAGLQDVKEWESDNTDTAAHPCSCNLEGIKPPAPPETTDEDSPSEAVAAASQE